MRKITYKIFLLFIALVFLGGCSTDSVTGAFSGADKDEPVVDREVKGDHFQVVTVFKGRNSLDEAYFHPLNLSSDVIGSALKGFQYQTRTYSQSIKTKKTQWSIPNRLFSEEEIPAIASGISRIFAQLKSNEEAYFYIDSNPRVEGKTYITSDGWYWFFRSIDGKGPKEGHVSKVKEWKISLKKGENYVVSRSIYQIKKVNVNWIAMPLTQDVQAEIRKKYQVSDERNLENYRVKKEFPGNSSSEGDFRKSSQRLDTEIIDEKVQVLNKLKEDGIITDQEYTVKLKEILRNQL